MSASEGGGVATDSVSQRIARVICSCETGHEPALKETAEKLLLDVAGLCVAARGQPYLKAVLASLDQSGPCIVIGGSRSLGVEGAMLVNGTAAHGEDFDDTYEGGPVHVGAVVVPALLAAAQRHQLEAVDVLRGIAIGAEVMCRLCKVAPMAVHKAGFHPTAIFGVMGAVAGIGAAMRLPEEQLASAFGIAGSMASGIIEYLSDGSWTKRMHPGWAAQSGYRAVRLAQAGFHGPRTVFEGQHGLFRGFANTLEGDFEAMLRGFGSEWIFTSLAFKPYACGTMAHPFIDCALEFRKKGIAPDLIERVECETAEGIVHRLWEPLALKSTPPNGYAAKFSIPYAIAVAMVRGNAGLSEYGDAVVADGRLTQLARKVSYLVDSSNPYPDRFIGHVRVILKNGDVHEHRQDFFRGGVDHPLTTKALRDKFYANCAFGGFSRESAENLARCVDGLFSERTVPDFSCFQG